jgi:hypothetical protein
MDWTGCDTLHTAEQVHCFDERTPIHECMEPTAMPSQELTV